MSRFSNASKGLPIALKFTFRTLLPMMYLGIDLQQRMQAITPLCNILYLVVRYLSILPKTICWITRYPYALVPREPREAID